jgi:hypothetical protein
LFKTMTACGRHGWFDEQSTAFEAHSRSWRVTFSIVLITLAEIQDSGIVSRLTSDSQRAVQRR